MTTDIATGSLRTPGSRRTGLARPAFAGAVAALAAIGIGELAAAILSAQSLVAAVGGVVIDVQPPGAKELVVALFGQNDKLVFELFIVAVSIVIGALLGIVARRRFVLGAGGIALFAFVGLAAALSDPSASAAPTALVAGIAGIAGVQALSSRSVLR